MKRGLISLYGCFSCLLFFTPVFAQITGANQLSTAFEKFWAASSTSQDNAIKDILSTHSPFDEIYHRLKEGKPYSSDVTKGFLEWYTTIDNVTLYCLVFIPYDYTPSKKYLVRFFLHGAVSNTDQRYINTWIDRQDTTFNHIEEIRVYPSAYLLAPWWSERQYKHVCLVLDRLKKIYNVDENNVRLGGVSDGGTGTYFFANADATPWSCFTPFIGSAGVLDQLTKKQIYVINFSNKPFFIVNGGHDNIFDPKTVTPYVKQILKLNPASVFILVDSSGHSMNWINVLMDSIDHFVHLHPRNPFPDTLVWQTERTDMYNRNHWIQIDKIGKARNDVLLDEPNMIIMDGVSKRAFHRDTISAIIKVTRSGNEIHVQTKNVKEFTLLLSPDQFDFSQPIRIITDEIESFNGMVEKNAETLLTWFAVDNDRTMLYGAELKLVVGKKAK